MLELTEAGRHELEKLDAAVAQPVGRAAHAPKLRQVSPGAEQTAHDSTPAKDMTKALDTMIRQLLESEAEKARSIIQALRLYHPREIAERLVSSFEASESSRVRARAVWGAGELCGQYALAFLICCASCGEPDIRRFAASALGKAARTAGRESKGITEDMEKAQQALLRLAEDSVPQVRQYATKSLNQFSAQGSEGE